MQSNLHFCSMTSCFWELRSVSQLIFVTVQRTAFVKDYSKLMKGLLKQSSETRFKAFLTWELKWTVPHFPLIVQTSHILTFMSLELLKRNNLFLNKEVKSQEIRELQKDGTRSQVSRNTSYRKTTLKTKTNYYIDKKQPLKYWYIIWIRIHTPRTYANIFKCVCFRFMMIDEFEYITCNN